MAFDKVVDSTALDTALTATADSIREKTGTSDPIAWLEELGFSEAIAAIEAGGDIKIAIGSVTYDNADTVNKAVITHNLGIVPNMFFMNISSNVSMGTHDLWFYYDNGNLSLTVKKSEASLASGSSVITESTISLSSKSSTVFDAGKTYNWMAVCTGGGAI